MIAYKQKILYVVFKYLKWLLFSIYLALMFPVLVFSVIK